MTPERWLEVKEMFAEALEQKPAERATYLKEVCADASLRHEVELMIAAHERGDSGFMERPPGINNEVLKSGAKWPAFDPKTTPTMIFDNQCVVKNDPDGEVRKAIVEAMA